MINLPQCCRRQFNNLDLGWLCCCCCVCVLVEDFSPSPPPHTSVGGDGERRERPRPRTCSYVSTFRVFGWNYSPRTSTSPPNPESPRKAPHSVPIVCPSTVSRSVCRRTRIQNPKNQNLTLTTMTMMSAPTPPLPTQ